MTLFGSSYHEGHARDRAKRSEDAAEARRLRRERDRYRNALLDVDVALGYLDATPIDDAIRGAHLDAARAAVNAALEGTRAPGNGDIA